MNSPDQKAQGLIFPTHLVRALTRHQTQAAPFLSQQAAQRLHSRLDLIKLSPDRILNLGCGWNEDSALLATRFPRSDLISLDLSATLMPPATPASFWSRWRSTPLRKAVLAQCPALPFKANTFTLIWANLLLPWIDPMTLFSTAERLLSPGGVLLFSSMGPDNLRELRQALAHLPQGDQRLMAFPDMHDLGDGLVHARLAEPIMEREDLCVHYPDITLLLQDLRSMGPAPHPRPAGLIGRQAWRRMTRHYENQRLTQGLPATLEIILGQAWKPFPRLSADGRPTIPIRSATES